MNKIGVRVKHSPYSNDMSHLRMAIIKPTDFLSFYSPIVSTKLAMFFMDLQAYAQDECIYCK